MFVRLQYCKTDHVCVNTEGHPNGKNVGSFAPQFCAMQGLRDDIGVLFAQDRLNTEDVRRLLENYRSNHDDWAKYEHYRSDT